MTTLQTTLKAITVAVYAGAASHAALLHAAPAEKPLRPALMAPATPSPHNTLSTNGVPAPTLSDFSATSAIHGIGFSADGARLCVIGSDVDPDGWKVMRMALFDRPHKRVEWQSRAPASAEMGRYVPVQCLVGRKQVFLMQQSEPPAAGARERAAVYLLAFGMKGEILAATTLGEYRADQYAYAMAEIPNGIRVVGSIKTAAGEVDQYATFSSKFDADDLRERGTPLLRKNGAYAAPVRARIVDDSTYIAGRFLPAEAKHGDAGHFSASRVRNDGGYLWSQRMLPEDAAAAQVGIAENGMMYSLSSSGGSSQLAIVGTDGKASKSLSFASSFCRTGAIDRYGDNVIAIRYPCGGAADAAGKVVVIDTKAGAERVLTSVKGRPLYLATSGALYAIVVRDAAGKTTVMSANVGEL